MTISVITPTADRGNLLKGTFELLKKQTYPNWEWLIYDTSLRENQFSDPRITYIFDEGIVSIGEKRNRLLEKAKGDFIVHFDDDDYYAPTYLERVLKRLQQASLFTLHSWFSYDTKTKQFFYWDTQECGEVHYCLNAISGQKIREIDFGPHLEGHKERLNEKGKKGYGFSFAYQRDLIEKCHFPDCDFGEDRLFYEEAESKGFLVETDADRSGEVIHIIHENNTSAEFPQYRVPHFLVQPLFPPFFNYLKMHYES